MTPEEEFEKWFDSPAYVQTEYGDITNKHLEQAFLAGYDRGKEFGHGLGYGQGWEQGYDDKEEMLRFREWTSQTK